MSASGSWCCGCCLALVFFSAAQNKLPGYVLPLLPALAIVLAVALDKTPARWLVDWRVRGAADRRSRDRRAVCRMRFCPE